MYRYAGFMCIWPKKRVFVGGKVEYACSAIMHQVKGELNGDSPILL